MIHQHSIKLADFGRSCIQGSDYYTYIQPHGVIPYMDPKIFNIKETESYNLTKKSDIYSLGVLLWEITSGHPPFENISRFALGHEISNGLREEPIEGTPLEYQQLYQKCWEQDPE